jgi:glycosyltransferase involved in cell wall biosynthesis
MGVAVLSSYPPVRGGGIASYVKSYLDEVKKEVKVFVITYGRVGRRDEHITFFEVPCVKVPLISGIAYFLTSLFYLFKIRKRIKLIHAHFLIPQGIVALVAGKLLGKKIAITLHGSDVRRYRALLPLLNLFDHIFVVSEFLKGICRRYCRKRIEVAYPVIPEVKIKEREKIYDVGYFGALEKHKGVERLIEKIRKMRDFSFLVVGEGRYERVVKRFKNVAFLPFQPRERAIELMSACRVVYIPSPWEGFGLVALEAILAGTAVCAESKTGVAEVVSEKAFLPLERIVESEELRRSIVEESREKIKKVGERSCISIYRELYVKTSQ